MGPDSVLITAGTSVRDADLLVEPVISAAAAGFEAAVTVEPGTLPELPSVHELGFVPLACVLPAVRAVMGTGGTGTTLTALAAGLPMVLLPQMADQPNNARRVVAAGAGICIDNPTDAGKAFTGADAVFWLVPADRWAPDAITAYTAFARPGICDRLVRPVFTWSSKLNT